jgi:hypothetical protein
MNFKWLKSILSPSVEPTTGPMHLHTLEYDLFCKSCRNIQPTTFRIVKNADESPEVLSKMSKGDLLNYRGGVPFTTCIYCGRTDAWEVLRIERAGSKKITNQFIISVLEEPERIKVSVEKGSNSYTAREIKLAVEAAEIEAKKIINELIASGKKSTMIYDASTKTASIFLVVDLFAQAPYAKVSTLDIKNMPAKALIGALNYLRQQFL